MNRLKLILPTQEHKNIIMDYKREFLENGRKRIKDGYLQVMENG